mmetsp:Transcript_22137/g.46707  ORF Transcript_22137/g.46707 Transcript_22137/m.46707 type:complete len:397 (-) Transcript_22137:168-1358(-)
MREWAGRYRMRCHYLLLLFAAFAPSASCFSVAPSAVATRRRSVCSQRIGHFPTQRDIEILPPAANPIAQRRHHQTTSTSLQSSQLISAIPAVPATDIIRTFVGIVLAQRISNSGLKKRSLSKSGALSAFAVASLSLATSWRNGVTLLAFYWTSSKLTRVGSKIKGKLEEGATEGGNRGASQVFACSLIAVICACIRRIVVGCDGPLGSGSLLGDQLTLAYTAFFACCAGDTWASELGVLSKSLPRLIIKPWKEVPPGTNGGISLVGLAASAAGGILMGLFHGLFVPGGIASLLPLFGGSSMLSAISFAQFQREVLVLTFVGFMGGFGGSLLDSLLGATIQATYYDNEAKKIAKREGPTTTKVGGWGFLSNEMVNVVSTAISALVAGLVARPLLNCI